LNLFILDTDPVKAAQLQCDKHASKMVVESGQMLSTVHRILDGSLEKRSSKSGKTNVKYWKLPDSRESVLYKAVHMAHPCTVWTMKTKSNYMWHYEHFVALANEFTYRYNKQHKTYTDLADILKSPPKNIPNGPLTLWPLAMKSNPECMFPEDPVKSYRMFYQTKQDRFKMVWKNRPVPEWFKYKETA
jgi:hypothetical protein